MKLAVTTTGPDLEAKVDPRFGRCPYFLIVETDDLSFEAIENSNAALVGGAGIQSARLLADRGVRFVLTGDCGPNAYQTLTAAGIGVVVGCSGVAKDVVEQFKAGGLSAAGEPSVPTHFGTAGTPNAPPQDSWPPQQLPGIGGGMGMGRGQGGGMGRGMGRGQGRGRGRGRGRGGGGGGGGGGRGGGGGGARGAGGMGGQR